MTAITVTDLDNAKLDVDHIAEIANSTGITATDRLGHVKDTISGAVYKITAFTDRGAWVPATAYAVKDLVSNGGSWYVAVVAHTSSAAFATDTATKWRLYQGVTTGDLSADSGSSMIGFKQSGAGATSRTVQDKERESVSVFDFMSPEQIADVQAGTALLDVTAAWTEAQNSAGKILVPGGTHLLDNFRPATAKMFVGDGYKSAFIKQAHPDRPAFNATSDATTGQLVGMGLIKVGVIGAPAATVEAVRVQAYSPYVVNKSEFDYVANNTKSALKIVDGGEAEVYSNKFKVDSLTSSGAAFITTGGYNRYDLIAEGCASGIALIDTSLGGIFERVISDGSQEYGGQNCTINTPTVEKITGAAVYSALIFNGYNHTVLTPTVTEVAQAKISGGGGAMQILQRHVIVNPRIWGVDFPTYPFLVSGNGAASTFIGGDVNCGVKLEQYLSEASIARLTLVGDVSTYSKRATLYPRPPYVTGAATYTIDANKGDAGLDDVVVFGGATTFTLTLPSGAEQIGRRLTIITRSVQLVVSASANVVPLTGANTTAILPAIIGKWVTLQYDGTYWYTVASNL